MANYVQNEYGQLLPVVDDGETLTEVTEAKRCGEWIQTIHAPGPGPCVRYANHFGGHSRISDATADKWVTGACLWLARGDTRLAERIKLSALGNHHAYRNYREPTMREVLDHD